MTHHRTPRRPRAALLRGARRGAFALLAALALTACSARRQHTATTAAHHTAASTEHQHTTASTTRATARTWAVAADTLTIHLTADSLRLPDHTTLHRPRITLRATHPAARASDSTRTTADTTRTTLRTDTTHTTVHTHTTTHTAAQIPSPWLPFALLATGLLLTYIIDKKIK